VTPYYEHAGITIFCADCRDMLPSLEVDVVITDPPYSARTHTGHNASASGHRGFGRDGSIRASLGYEPWTERDVEQYAALVTSVPGWIVTMTDHVLAPVIASAFERHGRYVFAPLPFIAPGSRVRLSGDGPSSWTIWIVVARTATQVRWGTLPGGYVAGEGWREREHMGGKPTALLRAIVSDYSRAGDIVLDPFMGGGSTLVAAKQLGRKAIGIEIDESCCERAARRLAQEVLPLEPCEPVPNQQPLFATEGATG
jgi:site-specific DNA-methyltransferase (adenine-specific)